MIDSAAATANAVAVPYAIELVGVTKRYGATEVLSSIDMEIEPGEFLVLLGPSGCGKSTLLKIVAGLEDPTEGDVYINGRHANYVRPKERDVAMVFQNYALYPHKTVEQNLGFPLKMRGMDKRATAGEIARVASLLELGDHLKKYPDQLSGGQRQRVALGRAIVRQPVAFLMDEPLSNLDALLRVQMRSELLELHRRIGRTTVYVTHDQVEAMTMASRLAVLRDGVLQQVGTSRQIYSSPANIFVATFVGSPQMNLFSGSVSVEPTGRSVVGDLTIPLGQAGLHLAPGTKVTVGVRPEYVVLRADGESDGLAGTIVLVETVGSEDYLTINVGPALRCVVRVDNRFGSRREGESVRLTLPEDSLHLFDAVGERIESRISA